MAGLEEMMAGLFGSNEAAGLDEMRRGRRGAPGAGGGYEGIGGAAVLPGMMQQYYGGLPGYDFSGAQGAQMGGRQGLMSLLGGRDLKGPALRHFQNQGFDFNPPGQDNREQPGGPNVAPGNIDDARSLYQAMGNPTPGVPQGVAAGWDPGQMRPMPRTQGWRNLAEGYSAAAQFGSGGPNDQLRGAGAGRGAPAAQTAPPGATGGGGRPGGGGGGGGGGPQSQNPVGGGGQAVAPAGPRGGGGGTGGGAATGGKQTGGGQPGPAQTPGLSTRPGSAGAGMPGNATESNQAAVTKAKVQIQRRNARQNAYEDAQNGVNNLFGNTINVGQKPVGQGGKGISGQDRSGFGGETYAEKQARLAAKKERQTARAEEAARVEAAPSASQFGKDSRGSGTEPLPKAGKTKPTTGARRGDPRQR